MAEHVRFSLSSWQQPMPPPAGVVRAAVLDHVEDAVLAFGDRRVRVAIDGRTAAGKTSLGHELAQRLAARGRVTLRASLDDFKRPWREADRYDRVSGEGYYRNAFDVDAIRRFLLEPAAPEGSGRVALCSIDPLTQIDHSATVAELPTDGALVVDGVFALRPELNRDWDLRIWVHVDPDVSLTRGITRDTDMEGGARSAEALHRDRYQAAEAIYIEEVDPMALADIVIDNTDFEAPRLSGS
jgi:uridine kinase